jgi:preprotein translocase subunit SecY
MFMQMAQASGLRGRLLVTIGLLILARLGIFIPIPGINRVAFAQAIQNSPVTSFLDIFSGGGLSAVGVFALGIIPYINASIIIQLLTTAIPALEKLQKDEGEAGRRKISQITRYVSLGWAILNSVGISFWLKNYTTGTHSDLWFIVGTTTALTAGAMFVMWLSELITERGIGNGASLLIFVNVVAVFPKLLGDTLNLANAGDSGAIGKTVVLFGVFIIMIMGIVYVQEGTRRIPIISAKRQVGRRLYRERTSYLPLRLNQGGVMPIIFASSVLALPVALAQFAAQGATGEGFLSTFSQGLIGFSNLFSPNTPGYIIAEITLIVFFSYFYSSLIVNPVDMSQNLKKMGASIPGIRPGRATSDYIERVLSRLTFLGAMFLGLVVTLPTIAEAALGISTFRGLGATSLLILVGVAIDTAKQIQTYVISQRYEGMVKQ